LYAHPITHDSPNRLSYVYIIVLVQKKQCKKSDSWPTFNICTKCSQNKHTDSTFTFCSIWSL